MNGFGLEEGEQENLYFPTNFNKDSKCKFKSRLGRRKTKPDSATHPMTPARSLLLEAKQGEALKDIANILQEPNPALNDSFVSDSSSTATDSRSGNLSESFKTPGRSFYLPCIEDSPLDPLQGILESPKDSSRTLFFSPALTVKKNTAHKTLFGKATDGDRSFGVSSLDDKKNRVPESRFELNFDQDSHARFRSNSLGNRSSTHPVSHEPSPLAKPILNSSSTRPTVHPPSNDMVKRYGIISQESRRESRDENSIGKINSNSVDSHRDNHFSSLFTPRINHCDNENRFKHLFDSDRHDTLKASVATSKETDSDRESVTDSARSFREPQQTQMRMSKTQDNIPSSLPLFPPKKVETSVPSFLKPIPSLDQITKNISAHFSKFSTTSNDQNSSKTSLGKSEPLGPPSLPTPATLSSSSDNTLKPVNNVQPSHSIDIVKPPVVSNLEKLNIAAPNSITTKNPSLFNSSSSSSSSSSGSHSLTPIVSLDEVDSARNMNSEEKMKSANSLFQASLLKNELSMMEGMEAPNNVPSRSSIFHSSIIKPFCDKEEPKNSMFPLNGVNHNSRGSSLLHNNNNYNKVDSVLKQDLINRKPDNRLLSSGEKHGIHHSNHQRQPVQMKKEESVFKKPQIDRNEDVFKKPSAIITRPVKQNPNLPDKVYVNGVGYPVLSLLGQGGSSKVYQALGEDSRLLAIKCVDLESVDQTIADGYLNEINLLARLQCCPSVIRKFNHEYKEQSKKLLVVMEKGDVDFANLIKSITKTKKISIPMIIYYWTEMLNCVNDIHVNGVIHSDLKPANFLLVGGRLKLIDFGIASPLQDDMTSVMKDVTTGTFNYMSPEAIVNHSDTQRGHKLSYKSDVWSLGCILYQLLYGRTPYSHVTSIWTKMQAIADPKCLPAYPDNIKIPVGLQIALRWCLNKDPKKRPTTSELLEVPYYPPTESSSRSANIKSLLYSHIMEMFPHCPVHLE